jgi:GNAT superfamily N-acetyltransferase
MNDIPIRFARPSDAETLSILGAQTFSDTFRHLYPPEDLAGHLAVAHAPERYAAWARDPAFGLWIAERDGEAVGYALAGPCHLPHPEVTPACGELWRIYVRQDLQGGGLGGRLMRVSLDWLSAPGRRLWIGVWSENHGAQRLYTRHGFEKVGEYDFVVGTIRDHEFILSRAPT